MTSFRNIDVAKTQPLGISLPDAPVLRARPWLWCGVGLAVHSAMLLAPLLAWPSLWPTIPRLPAAWLYLVGTALLFCADAWHRSAPVALTPPTRADGWWNAAAGLALLSLFWISFAQFCYEQTLGLDRSFFYSAVCLSSGTLLLIAGAVVRWLAIQTLGRRFVSHLAADPTEPLVTHGIYRMLRHPSETGLLVAALGAVMLLQSSIGWGCWLLVLLPITCLRVMREDRFLQAIYGDAHRRYAQQVRGMAPWM